MEKLTKEERRNRIIAIGESKEHAHTIIGDAKVIRNKNGEILIEAGNEEFALKHIIETRWVEYGEEIFTKDHGSIFIDFKNNKTRMEICENGEVVDFKEFDCVPYQIRQGDIFLERVADKTYKYVQQEVFDPLSKRIERVRE